VFVYSKSFGQVQHLHIRLGKKTLSYLLGATKTKEEKLYRTDTCYKVGILFVTQGDSK